jgi:hypothetical protein
MIINILSLAAHGKSYLAIKKALEFAADKRLNCMSWELDNPHMMKRVYSCLNYHQKDMSYPKNIHFDQMDFMSDKNQAGDMIRNKIHNYDVFLLDGILLLRPNAQEIMKVLECISAEFPEKIFIIPTHAKRPENSGLMADVHMQLKQRFFEIEPKDNHEFYMVVKQDSKDFIVYDRQEQTSKVLNAEEFMFGISNSFWNNY